MARPPLQRFAYAASHDLQEPLRTISNFTRLLEKRYRGRLDAEADTILTYIQQGASRMSTLIQGLLIYEQAGHYSGEEWTAVDLSQVLSWTLKDLEQSVTESSAMVTYDPLPPVKGNTVPLSQLFQNLTHNGLKYHSGGTRPHSRYRPEQN